MKGSFAFCECGRTMSEWVNRPTRTHNVRLTLRRFCCVPTAWLDAGQ